MVKCHVCDGEDFDLQGGRYYCTECATQSQDIWEENLEDDYTEGIKYVKEVKTVKERKSANTQDHSHRWRMAEAFNIILCKQADALIALGAHPDVKKAIFQVWSRYLHESEQAFVRTRQSWLPRLVSKPYPRDIQIASGKPVRDQIIGLVGRHVKLCQTGVQNKKVRSREDSELTGDKSFTKPSNEAKDGRKRRKRKKKQQANEEVEKKEKGEMSEADNNPCLAAENATEPQKVIKNRNPLLQTNRFSKFALETFKKRGSQYNTMKMRVKKRPDQIRMETTVSIIALALKLTRQPILLSDFTRWIKERHIPYFKAYKLLPPEWTIYPFDAKHFSRILPITLDALHVEIGRVHNFLQFPRHIPELSFQYIVSRFLCDMNLPGDMVHLVIILIEKYIPETSRRGFSSRLEFLAGIFILLALKYLFVLDDKTEKELSDIAKKKNMENTSSDTREYFVWTEWQDQMEQVVAYIRMNQTTSFSFLPNDCQDRDVIISYIQDFSSDTHETELTFKNHRYRVAESIMMIKKNILELGKRPPGSDKPNSEPANSFPITTILQKRHTKFGTNCTDYFNRRIDETRSGVFWFCHKSHHGHLPKSFMVPFLLLQVILDWHLNFVMNRLANIEECMFGGCDVLNNSQ